MQPLMPVLISFLLSLGIVLAVDPDHHSPAQESQVAQPMLRNRSWRRGGPMVRPTKHPPQRGIGPKMNRHPHRASAWPACCFAGVAVPALQHGGGSKLKRLTRGCPSDSHAHRHPVPSDDRESAHRADHMPACAMRAHRLSSPMCARLRCSAALLCGFASAAAQARAGGRIMSPARQYRKTDRQLPMHLTQPCTSTCRRWPTGQRHQRRRRHPPGRPRLPGRAGGRHGQPQPDGQPGGPPAGGDPGPACSSSQTRADTLLLAAIILLQMKQGDRGQSRYWPRSSSSPPTPATRSSAVLEADAMKSICNFGYARHKRGRRPLSQRAQPAEVPAVSRRSGRPHPRRRRPRPLGGRRPGHSLRRDPGPPGRAQPGQPPRLLPLRSSSPPTRRRWPEVEGDPQARFVEAVKSRHPGVGRVAPGARRQAPGRSHRVQLCRAPPRARATASRCTPT